MGDVMIAAAEPIFVAETFEPEHVAGPEAARAWWSEQGARAREQGGTWPRYSVHLPDPQGFPAGLLFECWAERPSDHGEPRWSFTRSDA